MGLGSNDRVVLIVNGRFFFFKLRCSFEMVLFAGGKGGFPMTLESAESGIKADANADTDFVADVLSNGISCGIGHLNASKGFPRDKVFVVMVESPGVIKVFLPVVVAIVWLNGRWFASDGKLSSKVAHSEG